MKNDMHLRIAYAEDHTAMRLGIISYLEQLGDIDIDIQACNGRELLEKMDKARSLPDICMIDIHMPEMDGFETVKALKAKWPFIKTLVLTAFENELYFIQMIKLNVNGLLLKNCHPNEIKRALQSIYQYDFYYQNAHAKHLYDKVKNGDIHLPHFTANELEFLKHCPADLSYSEIALKMGTTVKAIDGYRDRLCEKLNVKGRIGLALWAIQYGFVQFNQNVKASAFITGAKNNFR